MSSDSIDLTAHRVLIEACLKKRVAFFWRGPGTLLIASPGIQDVLREVMAQGNDVLGLEGFELESSDIHPRLDLIYDASRRPDILDPSSVVATWSGEIWVGVTLKAATGR